MILKLVGGIAFISIVGKIFGFLRDLVLAYYYGATGISDAFLISQVIPGTIFQFVGTGLAACFVPIYYRAKKDTGHRGGDIFTNNIISAVLIFSLVIIPVVWLFTDEIVWLFASGFSGETRYYSVWFTRIGILSLVFSTFVYVFCSYQQANEIFIPAAFAAIPNSICIMLAMHLGAKCNVWLLPIVSTLAVLVQLIFLIKPMLKLGFNLHLEFDFANRYLRDFFRLLLPVIVGVSVNEINMLVDRSIASNIAVGAISALTYANSIIMFGVGGIVQPLALVVFPKMTNFVVNNCIGEARIILKNVVMIAIALLLPLMAGLIVYRVEVIGFLFKRGVFDDDALVLTSVSLAFYAVGIVFMGLRELLSRYFYAYNNSKIPTRNAMIGVVVNIVLNVVLSKFLGIGGLALATSLAAIITTVLLWVNCSKVDFKGLLTVDVRDLLKIVLSTLAMILISKYFCIWYGVHNLHSFILSVLIAVIVYFVLCYALRLNCVNIFLKNRI